MACSSCGGSKITNTSAQARVVSQLNTQNSNPNGSVAPKIINSAPIRRTV